MLVGGGLILHAYDTLDKSYEQNKSSWCSHQDSLKWTYGDDLLQVFGGSIRAAQYPEELPSFWIILEPTI